MKASKQVILLIALHILLAIYSGSDVFSKYAALSSFFSSSFFICWFLVLVILGIYAIGWQQIIRNTSLTSAFLNKAITVVWGIFWGVLLFNESLNAGKIIGAILIIAGIALFVLSDKGAENKNTDNECSSEKCTHKESVSGKHKENATSSNTEVAPLTNKNLGA